MFFAYQDITVSPLKIAAHLLWSGMYIYVKSKHSELLKILLYSFREKR